MGKCGIEVRNDNHGMNSQTYLVIWVGSGNEGRKAHSQTRPKKRWLGGVHRE